MGKEESTIICFGLFKIFKMEIIHHAEARFHRAGDGTATLVCTDFGFDLLRTLGRIGCEAWFEAASRLFRHRRGQPQGAWGALSAGKLLGESGGRTSCACRLESRSGEVRAKKNAEGDEQGERASGRLWL
ncbi:hypothetical protein QSG27_03655 [Azospirillum sp. C340-1]|uniref:Uncharacterized protein n=1 Tax=Azospirillum isscasi TaxID=3053926 RepID=A0ABU0WCB8_9PROT|nr:hypothetical protein [Azospirillum isscasi]